MPAPALKIPVALDMESFRQQSEKAANHVGTTLRIVAQQFQQHNGFVRDVGLAAASRYGAGWVGTSAKIVSSFSAIKLAVGAAGVVMAGAILGAREQLEQLVEISNKAGASGVTGQFFQSFTREAKKLKVEVADLEQALSSAFEATKEKIDRVSPGLQKLQEYFLAGVASDKGPLDAFRNAGDQSDRVLALVKAIEQLRREGEELAAFDLAGTVFGKKFEDNLRLGKINISDFRQELERLKREGVRGGDIFSDDLVKRAADVDRELQKANQTLAQNLKPAWDGLVDTALTIKSVWADIVGLIAKAAGVAQSLGRPAAIRQYEEERSEMERRLQDPNLGFAQRSRYQGILNNANRELARYDAERYASDFQGDYPPPSSSVPLPRGRPDSAPKARETASSAPSRDRFDSAVDSIERRAAALDAETAAIDLGTAARERARVVAELETVAKQANTLAGVNNGEVTAEQAVKIQQVADAYARAAQAAEDARGPMVSFIREGRDLNKNLQEAAVTGLRGLEDALVNIGNRTQTVAEAFRQMASSIIADIGRVLIRAGISNFASLLTGGGMGGSGNGIYNPLAGAFSFGGGRAGGGSVSSGSAYVVGERGPELFVPGASGQVVPNDVVRSMGGGASITFAPVIDARGADVAAVARIEQALARQQADFEPRVKALVQSRGSKRW
jgi:hypothetical protein